MNTEEYEEVSWKEILIALQSSLRARKITAAKKSAAAKRREQFRLNRLDRLRNVTKPVE